MLTLRVVEHPRLAGGAAVGDRNPDCLPVKAVERELRTVVKANFGFGDVNACLIFSKYN